MLTVNFTPFPVLTTDGLFIRQINEQDALLLSQLRSIESMSKYIERAKSLSAEDAQHLIKKLNKNAADNEAIIWAVISKEEDRLIGTTCLWNVSVEDSRAEIGYELHPDFQGKGLMHQAVSKVIDFGFTVMQLKTIEAVVKADNAASIKLLQKFNFKRDAEAEKRMSDDLKNNTVHSLSNYLL
jgi:ribosomal-protein-alanine N-acetyltransferase